MISNQILSLVALAFSNPGILAQTEVPVPEETAPVAEQALEAVTEAPAEAPAGSTPAPQTDSQQAPAEQAPAEQAPAEQAPAEQAPAEQVLAEQAAASTPEASKELTASTKDESAAAPEPGPSAFKPGTGFVFTTADDRFSMGVRTRVQFRNETLITDKENDDEELETSVLNNFGIRRARLQFKGHMWGKNNKYKAELAFSPKDLGLKPANLGRSDGNPTRSPLLTWYSEHTQLRDLSLRIGQYKLYYNRQRVISSGNQEFVDRSEAQGEFNLDRDIGFHLFSKNLGGLDLFKYYAGASIGEGRDIWEAEDLTDGDNTSYQLLARFEVLPFGDFKDYSEGDFKRLDNFRLSVGAAYAYLRNGRRERGYQGSGWDDGGTVSYHNMTADALAKWKGVSAFGEFYWRDGERHLGEITTDEDGIALDPDSLKARNGLGGSFQMGYVLPGSQVNVGARYSTVGLGGYSSNSSTIDDNSELGMTVGFFPGGHPFKIQADYFHLWGDDYADKSADRIRLQMQVAY